MSPSFVLFFNGVSGFLKKILVLLIFQDKGGKDIHLNECIE